MNINRILVELREERRLIEEAIAGLEHLAQKRRGPGRPPKTSRTLEVVTEQEPQCLSARAS